MTEKERAEAHWNGYVGPMMRVMMDTAIEMSKFHYISSHIHGSKHGVEDECGRAKAVTVASFENAVAHTFSRGLHPQAVALDLALPSITVPGDAQVHHSKYLEESQEWNDAERGSLAEMIEAWDVLQAAQTWGEHERFRAADVAIKNATATLTRYRDAGRDVMHAKRIMLIKNAGRSRYSAEDNARILEGV